MPEDRNKALDVGTNTSLQQILKVLHMRHYFFCPCDQLTFCLIDFCSTDFFVPLFSSIVLVRFGLGEPTCQIAKHLLGCLIGVAIPWDDCKYRAILI